MITFLDWLTKYEAVAVWLEGIALVAIFIWDRVDANRDHHETVAQLKLAQDQIKLSQNAERAWLLTHLEWPDMSRLHVVQGTSSRPETGILEITSVGVTVVCRNEGRSPAWVEKIQGYCEIVHHLHDLTPPAGHEAQQFIPLGPIAPGRENKRQLILECLGHKRDAQLLSLFVLVEYRDIFGNKRVTTCAYTADGYNLYLLDALPERNKMT